MRNLLKDFKEVLLRQIRSTHLLDTGKPSSEAFQPMPKDQNRLSVDRASKTTPQQSFESFLERGFDSEAVFGLTVEEFNTVGISCYGAPEEINPAHPYADYSCLASKSQRVKVSKQLKQKAIERGKLHP